MPFAHVDSSSRHSTQLVRQPHPHTYMERKYSMQVTGIVYVRGGEELVHESIVGRWVVGR